MHAKKIVKAGEKPESASKALIMLHGRGSNAEDILSLAPHLKLDGFTLWAPQATQHSWYPYSFLAVPRQNQPWLNSALELLKGTLEDLLALGFKSEHIYLLGFSQGACLCLEFSARHAQRFGGVIAFTGGLIGDQLYRENYKGDFQQTPIFIGSSDPDPHVPVDRVNDSVAQLREMNASVDVRIYPGMGHTINADEIAAANLLLSSHSQK
jgi:phospholipase/carboxylesterase